MFLENIYHWCAIRAVYKVVKSCFGPEAACGGSFREARDVLNDKDVLFQHATFNPR